jgi:hypothetical protein
MRERVVVFAARCGRRDRHVPRAERGVLAMTTTSPLAIPHTRDVTGRGFGRSSPSTRLAGRPATQTGGQAMTTAHGNADTAGTPTTESAKGAKVIRLGHDPRSNPAVRDASGQAPAQGAGQAPQQYALRSTVGQGMNGEGQNAKPRMQNGGRTQRRGTAVHLVLCRLLW